MKQTKNEVNTNLKTALSNFSSMPDNAYVRLPVVRALYGVSTATVWRNSAKGLIPPAVRLSVRCTAWNVGMLREDLAAKGAK